MLGLATVLTDQGMEGIAAFVPPAPPRPKAAQPVQAAPVEDEADAISRGTWILAGAIGAVVLASGLGYWLAASPDPKPVRSTRVVTKPIEDMSGAASAADSAASSSSSASPPEAASEPASHEASAPPAQQVTAEPPVQAAPAREPPQRRVVRRPARPASESVFVANPEWTSQVRRIGDVDAETERSTMTILDSIHNVQERERPSRASAAKGAQRE